MTGRQAAALLMLAALWGSSFLFMRLGAADFGPVALGLLRCSFACLALLPLLAWRGHGAALRAHWRPIAVVGLMNSALPFLCFGYAVLHITGALSAVFNSTAPLWGALIAWLWLKEAPGRVRAAGLAIGFAGVLWLAWDKAGFKPGASGGAPLAVAACLLATLCYGFSANYTRKHLGGVPPLAVAAGSQLAATTVLLLPALWAWPAVAPPPMAWLWAGVLGVACTGLAYLLFFHLIAQVGAQRAITVTFLIPLFAAGWGAALLDERITPVMVVAGGVILFGAGLVTGLLAPRWPWAQPARTG